MRTALDEAAKELKAMKAREVRAPDPIHRVHLQVHTQVAFPKRLTSCSLHRQLAAQAQSNFGAEPSDEDELSPTGSPPAGAGSYEHPHGSTLSRSIPALGLHFSFGSTRNLNLNMTQGIPLTSRKDAGTLTARGKSPESGMLTARNSGNA